MGIPNNSLKVVLSGTSPAGEIWETGYWIVGTTINSTEAANDAAEAIRDIHVDTNGLWSKLQAVLSADWAFTEVRVYVYTSGAPADFVGTSIVTGEVGTASNAALPLQICMVASLLTGHAGKRFRGRMYLPAGNVATLSTGMFSGSQLDDIALALANDFGAINTAFIGDVSVVSQTGSIGTPVTSVRIDNKPDTQRRRSNKSVATLTFNSDVP